MIPVCYREAYANSRERILLERQLAGALEKMPGNAKVMMYTSEYVGAVQQAGVSLDRVVSECSGIAWDAALSAPFAAANYVVAIDGDPVSRAVKENPRGLMLVSIFHTRGKPEVRFYRSLGKPTLPVN